MFHYLKWSWNCLHDSINKRVSRTSFRKHGEKHSRSCEVAKGCRWKAKAHRGYSPGLCLPSSFFFPPDEKLAGYRRPFENKEKRQRHFWMWKIINPPLIKIFFVTFCASFFGRFRSSSPGKRIPANISGSQKELSTAGNFSCLSSSTGPHFFFSQIQNVRRVPLASLLFFLHKSLGLFRLLIIPLNDGEIIPKQKRKKMKRGNLVGFKESTSERESGF